MAKNCGRLRQTVEVKGHVYREINRQKYEFPVFTGKIMHAHTVCTRPFLLPSKGLGTRVEVHQTLKSVKLISNKCEIKVKALY